MKLTPTRTLIFGLIALSLTLVVILVQTRGASMNAVTQSNLNDVLDEYAGSSVPGLQYVVVDANATLFEYAGGWADIQNRKPMALGTTLMAYSMTKTLTAVAVLQLVEQGKLGLDERVDRYLPNTPYVGQPITVRHLLAHTSGLPNPIPIRWAHLVEEDAGFEEEAALARVLKDNPKLAFAPGQKYAYNNIGYWLLGKIIERVSGQGYGQYLRVNVLDRLGLAGMGFVISEPQHHANGYLARYTFLNLVKGFVLDKKSVGGYEGNWLRLKSHHLNGPAFGGLVGTAQGFAQFLQDQLRPESVLFGSKTKELFQTQQKSAGGEPIPMTLGWHIGETEGVPYWFKEGGGGGFHCEMRLYPTQRIASVVMVNSTQFSSSEFLNRVDGAFVQPE